MSESPWPGSDQPGSDQAGSDQPSSDQPSRDQPSRAQPNRGEHALRLSADRTRDELRDALDEIGQRLTPAGLARSVQVRAERDPGTVSAIGAGVVAAIVGVVWFAIARKRG